MINIIPKPVSITSSEKKFVPVGNFVFEYNSNDQQISNIVSQLSSYIDNLKCKSTNSNDESSQTIKLVKNNKGEDSTDEGYSLNINNEGIELTASSYAGLFYATQSLIQILYDYLVVKDSNRLPVVSIEDYPRFTWRGMHLDVSRHFFPIDKIKRYLDMLAIHKFNRFHWHLVDDQGWRIEIEKYPKLTDIGAWRNEEDGSIYGGYYSKDDIREIVRYASDRYITVVPEIEMPGHSMAALSAYPDLSCMGKSIDVPNKWGVFDDVFCVGKEETYLFLKDILLEVLEMFPSEYVHIGGDECPKIRWKKCPECQALIKSKNLIDENDLQRYFISKIGTFLKMHNRKMIGWDEILDQELSSDTTVMVWRDIDKGCDAVELGCDVIMSPTSHCYFDYYQFKGNEPKAIGGYLPLETVYQFDPIPDNLSSEKHHYIKGGQGNVWTEYMKDWNQVAYMAFPRMSALAETLWTKKEDMNFESFQERLLVFKIYVKNV